MKLGWWAPARVFACVCSVCTGFTEKRRSECEKYAWGIWPENKGVRMGNRQSKESDNKSAHTRGAGIYIYHIFVDVELFFGSCSLSLSLALRLPSHSSIIISSHLNILNVIDNVTAYKCTQGTRTRYDELLTLHRRRLRPHHRCRCLRWCGLFGVRLCDMEKYGVTFYRSDEQRCI